METDQIKNPLILFDGYCNLCNGGVNFILKRDKEKVVRFSPLQSDLSKRILFQHGISSDKLDTLYFIEDSNLYQKSEAVFKIIKIIRGWWRLLLIFRILPRRINNFFYDLIAKSRYTLFGKREECRIPTQEEKEFFFD